MDTTAAELADLWAKALESLGDGTLTPQQRAFVSLTRPLGLVEDTALIAPPNDFTKDVLETRLRPVVTAALTAQLGREVRLAVTVDPGIAAPPSEDEIDAVADARRKTVPARRFGTPDEFGATCAFLCSMQASYITGQNVLIDGGAYPGTY